MNVPIGNRQSAIGNPIARGDADNPWLGLASFSEETRAYFHGRDDEIAELGRRVQRKLLTILFGQSGFGKTSILRAGVVPKLRNEGYCPVYVRIDYSADALAPAEQVKAAVRASGGGEPGETASLWEYFHHRAESAGGPGTTPLLIFDQFEEVFTLGQSDDAGRQRANAFLQQLADLVENRPPAELEARIDRDDSLAERFDFARADYRVLISLREDYLAHLETLKSRMPSVTQNRLRLGRMTGAQALAAVVGPGRSLVSDEVAQQIVLFVSGARDLATAEVEPSLLSLVCRELNEARKQKGHSEISADLLAGSRETILTEFYERALADQPRAVRTVIEDTLLTDSGFRESVAEERLRKALLAGGAPSDALETLVARRVLRIEDRLDVRRVELTHDVLCPIVRASRDTRHEREAKEAAEAQLAATREKEAETRRALQRSRRFAAVGFGLSGLAAAGAIFGFVNQRRANRARAAAEVAAAQARAAEDRTAAAQKLAENARAKAEKLVSFLLDDFFEELAPTGRLETVGRLAEQAIAYYDGLPAELRSRETIRNRAVAVSRLASVHLAEGKRASAAELASGALADFEKLWAEGDRSEATALGFASALRIELEARRTRLSPAESLAVVKRSAELIRPYAEAANASVMIRRHYAYAKMSVGSVALSIAGRTYNPDAFAQMEEARSLLRDVGAADLSDVNAATNYAFATARMAQYAAQARRLDEAERWNREAIEIAEKVLAKRPSTHSALLARAQGEFYLCEAAFNRGDVDTALVHAEATERACLDYLKLNPGVAAMWDSVVNVRSRAASIMVQQGRISAALDKLRSAFDLKAQQTSSSATVGNLHAAALALAQWEARRGNRAAAENALAEGERYRQERDREMALPALSQEIRRINHETSVRIVQFGLHDYDDMIRNAEGVLPRIDRVLEDPGLTEGERTQMMGVRSTALADIARALTAAGRNGAAEAAWRQAIDERAKRVGNSEVPDFWRQWFGIALARLGKLDAAREIMANATTQARERYAKGDHSVFARWNVARGALVLALCEGDDAEGRKRALALLDEGERALDGPTDEAKQLTECRRYLEWIRAERVRRTGPAERSTTD